MGFIDTLERPSVHTKCSRDMNYESRQLFVFKDTASERRLGT